MHKLEVEIMQDNGEIRYRYKPARLKSPLDYNAEQINALCDRLDEVGVN
ncbi:MAG: hypothetical protein Q9M91_06000 [Candidatus Dojkabacteria bacterium]|nr:hypothetical protein [Candidatus Dojkabacteria bacterium]MDQ7021352.1 hypothetical protein [Candidatus Dojkabacteria bacterium]